MTDGCKRPIGDPFAPRAATKVGHDSAALQVLDPEPGRRCLLRLHMNPATHKSEARKAQLVIPLLPEPLSSNGVSADELSAVDDPVNGPTNFAWRSKATVGNGCAPARKASQHVDVEAFRMVGQTPHASRACAAEPGARSPPAFLAGRCSPAQSAVVHLHIVVARRPASAPTWLSARDGPCLLPSSAILGTGLCDQGATGPGHHSKLRNRGEGSGRVPTIAHGMLDARITLRV